MKKLLPIKKNNAWFTYHVLLWKKFLLYLFVGIFLAPCSFFFHGRFSYCHKILRRRCCRGPKSFSVCTNTGCMCKQSYSSACRKIITGHCEFNLWSLYLTFKIQYQTHQKWTSTIKDGHQSAKTQSIGEVVYELNTK